jgi:hypothetical protein
MVRKHTGGRSTGPQGVDACRRTNSTRRIYSTLNPVPDPKPIAAAQASPLRNTGQICLIWGVSALTSGRFVGFENPNDRLLTLALSGCGVVLFAAALALQLKRSDVPLTALPASPRATASPDAAAVVNPMSSQAPSRVSTDDSRTARPLTVLPTPAVRVVAPTPTGESSHAKVFPDAFAGLGLHIRGFAARPAPALARDMAFASDKRSGRRCGFRSKGVRLRARPRGTERGARWRLVYTCRSTMGCQRLCIRLQQRLLRGATHRLEREARPSSVVHHPSESKP